MNAHITTWIPVAEATTLIKEMIASEKYTKKQIKKSSYRWADPKDHSKGYLCRVVVEAGIHPELEIAPLPRGRKKAEAVASEEENVISDHVA